MRCMFANGAILVALALVSGGGCAKRPPPIPPPDGSDDRRDDSRSAYQLIKNATTTANHRDALDRVNTYLNNAGDDPFPELNAAGRKRLGDEFRLTKKEIDFVAKSRFQPLDAAHLNTCLFIRDVANTLKVVDLSKVEQARLVCGWVAQQVVLQEPAKRWFPPRWTLLSGEGAAAERAMLIVHLLRQMEIDACALKTPDDSPDPLLIGVLADKNVYVFDPKLGIPVSGPSGEGVATWKDVQSQPMLTAKHGLDGKQTNQLQPYLICSLPELSPRMLHLEKSLAEHDLPVVLAVAPEDILNKWRTASKYAAVWNRGDGVSPLRALEYFFPEEEDTANKHATVAVYQAHLVPSGAISRRMGELGLLNGLIDNDKIDPKERLLHWSTGLFFNYAIMPRRQSLQGQYDAMNKRMGIIRKVMSNIDFAPLPAAERDRKIAKWKERVNGAYLAWKQNADAEQRVNRIWNNDLFVRGLLLSPEDPSFRRYSKKLMTYMLMAIVQTEIQKDLNWTSAQHWHTKAVLQQDANRAKRGWSAALRRWQKYLARHDQSVAAVNASVGQFSRSVAFAVDQWNRLATDLTRAAHAKSLLAETFYRNGETDKAKKQWQNLERDIASLLGDKSFRKELTAFVDAIQQHAAGSIGLATALNRITNLVDPNGSLANVQKKAAFHLAK